MTNQQVRLRMSEEKRFQKGYPLILQDYIERLPELQEGELFDLVGAQGTYYGTAYYGVQNKGIGWIVSKDPVTQLDRAYFMKLLKKSYQLRQDLHDDPNTNAYRIMNGEGDHFGGLTIDLYNDQLLLQWYSEGAYSFRRVIYDVLMEVVQPRSVYEKKRFDRGGEYIEQDDFVMGETTTFPQMVKQDGIQYAIDLNDGPMTGVFLDQREVRRYLRDELAEGQTVLNTFSYTGAFSVAAMLGGAKSTTSVDLAKRSEAKTIEQMSINGIDFEAQEIRVMDVFNYFNYAERHQLKWDVVVLDPPSFARSKKMSFSTSKDYDMLIERAANVTARKGTIIASTNTASLDMKKFKKMVEEGMRKAGRNYKIVEEFHLPSDFRTPRSFREFDYLKVLILQLKN